MATRLKEAAGISPISLRFEQLPPKVSIDVSYPRGESGPWRVDVSKQARTHQIKAYDIRDDSQKSEIAAEIAGHRRGVGFGVGLYGAFVLLNDPRRTIPEIDPADYFTQLKPTRAPHEKVTTYVPPKDVYGLIDFDKIHPQFRELLRSREWRENAWRQGVSFHLVVPTPDHAHFLHPLLVTTPEDLVKAGKPPDQQVSVNTTSAFWWHDPDMEEVAERVATLNPFGFVGMSSFNEHGKQPAYTFEDVLRLIQTTGVTPDFIIRDRIGEAVGVKSSHPQIRVPLVGESAEWILVRHGSISIDGWLQAIDSPFPARGHESAAWATRADSRTTNLDNRVFKVRDEVEEDYQRRHPSSGYLRRAISLERFRSSDKAA